jgi:hypothetical protein
MRFSVSKDRHHPARASQQQAEAGELHHGQDFVGLVLRE